MAVAQEELKTLLTEVLGNVNYVYRFELYNRIIAQFDVQLKGQPDELSKAQERCKLLEQVLRECRALMRFGKNDIDRNGPIWQQIEDALKP